jgi:hypothetical protein
MKLNAYDQALSVTAASFLRWRSAENALNKT